MAAELRADTVRKKELACESLKAFLARMTLVWEDRQRRLAGALARGAAASQRAIAKAKAADPDGFKAKRLAAVKRYAKRHPDRIKAKEKRAAAARKAQRHAERGAKRASQPEGYPKAPAKSSARVTSTWKAEPVVSQDDLSRAWFALATAADSRPEGS